MDKVWASKKLDELERELEQRLRDGFASSNAEEVSMTEVLGYWYYKLKDCRK